MTVQDFLTSALSLINVAGAGETPGTGELADALRTFNELLSAWNTEHQVVYSIVQRTKVLTANVGTYTFGAGGNINSPRPVKIESAGITQANGLRMPMQMITSLEWANIPEKTAKAKQPVKLYNDNDYPLTTLHIWPVPSGTPTMDLNVWEELTEPMLLTDNLDLPPGYHRAIRYNLALSLAAEWGKQVTPEVAAIAQSAKQALFNLNASNETATEDAPQAPKQ